MKFEVDVLGSPYGLCWTYSNTERELLCSEFRSWVNEEMDVLGSTSLIVRTVSVDVKQQ